MKLDFIKKIPVKNILKNIFPAPFKNSVWHTVSAVAASVVLGVSLIFLFNLMTTPKEKAPVEDIAVEENASVPAEESEVAE